MTSIFKAKLTKTRRALGPSYWGTLDILVGYFLLLQAIAKNLLYHLRCFKSPTNDLDIFDTVLGPNTLGVPSTKERKAESTMSPAKKIPI